MKYFFPNVVESLCFSPNKYFSSKQFLPKSNFLCLPLCLPPCLPPCLPSWLPPCLLPVSLTSYLHASVPASLPDFPDYKCVLNFAPPSPKFRVAFFSHIGTNRRYVWFLDKANIGTKSKLWKFIARISTKKKREKKEMTKFK